MILNSLVTRYSLRYHPRALRLQQFPRPRDVFLFCTNIANRQVHDEAIIQFGVRQKYITMSVDGVENIFV